MPSRPIPYNAFAVAAPGLSGLVADEVRELGIEPTAVDEAGVEFQADALGVYRANLQLRIASRVVIRAASFRAAHFSDLEKHARRVPWERWLSVGTTLALRVTSRKSRLYHSDAVAERLYAAIAQSVKGVRPSVAEDEDNHGAQLVVARIDRDQCTLSVDSSGALLHRRGYRQEVAKAPLRETLAAAILRASGWSGVTPLLDPLCGAGTIPIEAGLLARRIPPGLHREFAFEHWPEFNATSWRRVKEDALERILRRSPVTLHGSDRDDGAIAAAQSNARRAGVEGDVEFVTRAISEVPSMHTTGHLVTNPPYGARIGEARPLRDLYSRLGHVVGARLPGWTVAILTSDAVLARSTALSLSRVLETSNGGIRVGLWVATTQPRLG
ncbi:MAG: THUMP domain-containing class I SAM-dependent RNA methyltransferase [Gemmatimonadaceae bacterium]